MSSGAHDHAALEPAAQRVALERRTFLRVVIICAISFPLLGAINATSLITDFQRAGTPAGAGQAWLLEMTSAVAALALLPVVAVVERRFSMAQGTMLRHGVVLAAFSVPFSLAHVALMVGLRIILVPLFFGGEYVFFTEPLTDLVYEYRKDLFTYAAMIGLLTLSRQIEVAQLETAAAREEARTSGQLTLKSGGRTLHLRGRDVDWAQSSGNYVDVMAGEKTYLPRITLSELEAQLRSAKVDVVRVHRSRLVNRARISEVRPTRSGDVDIHLVDGSVVKGSRRYREALTDSGG